MPDTDLNHEFEQRAQRIAERCEPYVKPVDQVAFEIEEALHEAYFAGVKSASVLSAVGSSSLQQARLVSLAETAAFNRHINDSHPESFDVCIADDCAFIRVVKSQSVPPSLLRGLRRYEFDVQPEPHRAGCYLAVENQTADGEWVKFSDVAALLSGKGK